MLEIPSQNCDFQNRRVKSFEADRYVPMPLIVLRAQTSLETRTRRGCIDAAGQISMAEAYEYVHTSERRTVTKVPLQVKVQITL
jgi:hypothetical protein